MKTILFFFVIFCNGINAFSAEVNPEKKLKWELQLKYGRLYNYRYAKLPPDVDNSEPYVSYLDTGHIATYTNLLGFLIQRKIWKFIHLQTGLTLSRRGYLGTYVRYSTHNEIDIIPRKVIFIPFILNFNFMIKKKLKLEVGIGREWGVFTANEILDHNSKLYPHSNGFFGYQWAKRRTLESKTIVADRGSGVAGINHVLNVSIGYKINQRFLISVNGNYMVEPHYYRVRASRGDPTLNLPYKYEVKPYIIALGTSLAYCF